MSFVYVKFPKTGLGNLLLLWARARIFSEINNLPLVTSLWCGIRPGAWIRNEKRKRIYWGYFIEHHYSKRFFAYISTFFLNKVIDPLVDYQNSSNNSQRKVYIYQKVVTEDDLFSFIRDHREFIINELYRIIQPKLIKQLDNYIPPFIGVHIRKGDFQYSNQITPNNYFISAIQAVRKSIGMVWPVTIFTDAEPAELSDILSLPHVNITSDKPDIVDLLLLSKSRVLILSQSSTFSYWAAFLSDAWVIKPRGDWQKHIRSFNDPKEILFDSNEFIECNFDKAILQS